MSLQKSTKGATLAITMILLLTGTLPIIGAVPPQTSTAPHPAAVPATDYWALCVGVGVYAENPDQDRPLMISEVDAFAQTLLDSGYLPDHVKVIKGENATLHNILDGFRWLRTHEKASDVSVVFLSTHGSPLRTKTGKSLDFLPKDEADGVDELLVTYWGFAIPSDVLIDDDINVELNHLPSQNVCLIVDSCYAGGFNDHWRLLKGFGDHVKGQNRVILMGSCEDEEAMSGGFAPWLVDGLRGYADQNHDGIVTAEEAFNYTLPRAYGQTPTIYDGYPGELPLVTVPQKKTQQAHPNLLSVASGYSMDAAGLVQGFIKDVNTANPIGGATVDLHGRTSGYENFENITTTNATGYYKLTAPAGRYRLTVSAADYCNRDSGSFTMNDNQVKWLNLSLYPRPVENATLCGYVVNNVTHEPLNGTQVSVTWRGYSGQSYTNRSLTNPLGFYTLSVAAGSVSVSVQRPGYFDFFASNLNIVAFETYWLNASLVPHPAETAEIVGFLTDADTGAALANVQLTYQWVDLATNRSYTNTTSSSSSGFYSISVSPGELYRDIRVSGYDTYDPFRHDGKANATCWQNISLAQQRPSFGFLQPLNALYLRNKRVVPWSSPVVIGSLNISMYFEDMWYGGGNVQKVEFYVDGVLRSTVTAEPFSWMWSARSLGRHVLKVVAYNAAGLSVSHEKTVLKIL